MATNDDDGNEPPPKGGLGIFPLGLIGAVAAAVSAAGGYFLTNPPSTVAHDTQSGATFKQDEGYNQDAKASKKSANSKTDPAAELTGGVWRIVGESAFLELDPLVISISPIGRSRHLKVSLVIETPLTEQSALSDRIFFVQDALTVYLRSVEARHLEDPAEMFLLRNQIRRRIAFVAPGVEISNVLITEFILT